MAEDTYHPSYRVKLWHSEEILYQNPASQTPTSLAPYPVTEGMDDLVHLALLPRNNSKLTRAGSALCAATIPS